jgi:endonuclease VIII
VPEGDTVWNTARALHRALAGERLTGTDFRVPRLATTDLSGWTVRECASRGKHLLLRVADDRAGADREPTGPRPDPARAPATGAAALTLHSHLRMEGSWRTYPPGARWAARPAHVIRVVLRTARAVAVGYHLHDLALVPTPREDDLVGHLGPDLLGADWDPAEAVRRLRGHPDTAIAEALLDQASLAGIGNLYKCELLYLRGVWPWTPVRDTPDLPGMVALAHRLLLANRGRWTQSTTGLLHRGQTTYVYGRRAEPCRRCGAPVGRAEQGERVTYWCPRCQPEPSPAPAGG